MDLFIFHKNMGNLNMVTFSYSLSTRDLYKSDYWEDWSRKAVPNMIWTRDLVIMSRIFYRCATAAAILAFFRNSCRTKTQLKNSRWHQVTSSDPGPRFRSGCTTSASSAPSSTTSGRGSTPRWRRWRRTWTSSGPRCWSGKGLSSDPAKAHRSRPPKGNFHGY